MASESLPEFSVYILRCADGTYYTGIAKDVERRVEEHRSGGRGAKYLKGRSPLALVFSHRVGDRSLASKVEYRIKKLSRSEKTALVDGQLPIASLLADQVSSPA